MPGSRCGWANRPPQQFLIATHSPLLLACPDATIYRFDAEGIAAIPYDAADNVVLLRHFLADPEAFVRRL